MTRLNSFGNSFNRSEEGNDFIVTYIAKEKEGRYIGLCVREDLLSCLPSILHSCGVDKGCTVAFVKQSFSYL